MSVSFIRTSDHLTITFEDGVTATVYPSSSNYEKIVSALRNKFYSVARDLALPAEQVKLKVRDTFGIPEEQVTVEHGIVKYEGKEMDNTLTKRMLQMLEEGFDISPLKLFLINLQQNPSYRAVNELYGFLEKGNLPITEDGYFLAYKKVRADYKDCHTGTIDNSVGQTPEMPRNEVDDNSRNECSRGYHFCSRDYLSQFGGEHTMIVKINPADVVAIPTEYNSSKGRTCRYEVIGELGVEGKLEGSFRDTGTRPAQAPPLVTDEVDEDWQDEVDFDDDLAEAQVDADCRFYTGRSLQDLLDEDTKAVTAALTVTAPDGTSVQVPVGGSAELLDAKIQAIDPMTNDLVMEFDTVDDAATRAGTTKSAILRVLKGERKTTARYAWKYSDKRYFKVTTPDVINAEVVDFYPFAGLQASYKDEDFVRAEKASEEAVDGVAVVEHSAEVRALMDEYLGHGCGPLSMIPDSTAFGTQPTELDSTFVGIPADGEPVMIPREVALEIANSLHDEVSPNRRFQRSIRPCPIKALDRATKLVINSFVDVEYAAKWACLYPSEIRRVLNGTRKTAGGYIWKQV